MNNKLNSKLVATPNKNGGIDYVLYVDPAPLGVEMKEATPEHPPKRPSFTELADELKRRSQT